MRHMRDEALSKDLDPRRNIYVVGIIPELNFRFVLGRDSSVAAEVAQLQGASDRVRVLLGETMLAAFFLSTHSSKSGRDQTVSLHIEYKGLPRRLIAFAASDGAMRATVDVPDADWQGALWRDCDGGILRVNRWLEENRRRVYGSVVQMRDVDLAKNLEEYMGRSDQIQSFIRMDSTDTGDATQVSGYMFQAMPDTSADQVDAVLDMLGGRSASEVLSGIVDGVGGGYSNQNISVLSHTVRVLKSGNFYTYCDCNKHKVEKVILMMGAQSASELLESHGVIEVQCEFCKRHYQFHKPEVDVLFQSGAGESNAS
ncbi:MAG: Hsp33 family molecular chaperone HslO [Leptospiraceae bacterium]|nr:Hsp33 family molecular chaperone HslO [Leptospiraceae bacterium]